MQLSKSINYYIQIVLTGLVLAIHPGWLSAQQTDSAQTPVTQEPNIASQLNDLAGLIERRIKQRDNLQKKISDAKDGATNDEAKQLTVLNRDLEKLRETFHFLTLGVSDVDIFDSDIAQETTWQQDVVDILKPLTDSLKSVTKRPRQIATLRETILLIDQRRIVIEQALANAERIATESLDSNAATQMSQLLVKWREQDQQLTQERLIAVAQLDSLNSEEHSPLVGIIPATRSFLLGRGLTVLLALIVATLTWVIMRALMWLYTRYFTSKETRRHSMWFRVLTYSYYLITIFFVTFAVLAVLYVREDLLLLALAFVLIAGAALSFRHFFPRYVTEARLLLNLGSVREDERVVYNGLPWQIMSLNLYSVLRNPALDGVIRLPLETMSTLVSRPVKHKLWFPSYTGDYIILPDDLLGQIKQQTPDLVEINVRGGMSLTYTTADFYAMNIINLSRENTFGVSITFGLDYSLQAISLTEIPVALESAVHEALEKKGYKSNIVGLIVELSEASASSLDYLVFVTMKSEVASDFYKIGRLLTQTCVSVSNEHGWTIPFPQLTIHQPA